MSHPDNLTDLLRRAQDGEAEAADALFGVTYGDLRKLAHARLRAGGRSVTLDTSSLVNESYLRFAASGRVRFEDRVHFMRWAGRVMRSVIVDFARRRKAGRRGGDLARVTLTAELGVSAMRPEDEILGVHDALEHIASIDGRLAQVVELRYFGGMTDAEIAAALDVTDRTVRRDWERARLLLAQLLGR